MTFEEFKKQIEQPLEVNKLRMLNSNSRIEQEYYQSNKVTLGAAISRTIRYCLLYPELAKEYYDSLSKAICDKE